jgi:hypothetical protein
MNKYSNNTLNTLLRKYSPKNPVIFTFHLNWKVYENFQTEQFRYIQTLFENNRIKIELLPILTDKKSTMESRIDQFKRGVEKIVDKYNRKAHIVAYSFSGILPRGYISLHNGDEYVSSLLTLGTPHGGSRAVDFLISGDYESHMALIEPSIRSIGVHRDWILEEYSSKTMADLNLNFLNSPNVKYMSVGGRREQMKCSEGLRVLNESIKVGNEEPNDGLVTTQKSQWGDHLMNFDADHFELIGMRQNFNSNQMFEFYSNAIKNADDDFQKEYKNRIF